MLDDANLNWLWASLAMGIGATLAIDLWATLLKRSFGITPTSWALVGRWVGGIKQGRFRLQGETGETPLSYELPLGWIVHYGVGIAYAFAYLILMWAMSTPLSLSTALFFGLADTAAGSGQRLVCLQDAQSRSDSYAQHRRAPDLRRRTVPDVADIPRSSCVTSHFTGWNLQGFFNRKSIP